MIKLFGYWRSSATYRVRCALALKNIDYEYHPVNLLKGEQTNEAYIARNPLGLVPSIEADDGAVIVQSLAIMEYLEDVHPTPSILPASPAARGHARAIAASIACEAQPFMNLRIQQYLKNDLGLDADAVKTWLNRWPGSAMAAAEKMVAAHGGEFSVGDTPSIADCCLVPQVFAAKRFGVDVSAMPRLTEIYERCIALPALETALPENQPDAKLENV